MLQEQIIDLSYDIGLQMTHHTKTEFWCDVEEYPDIGKLALLELLPFGSTYLCAVTFSCFDPHQIQTLDEAVESSLSVS